MGNYVLDTDKYLWDALGVDKVFEIALALVVFVIGEMLIRRVKRYARERRKP
jgi:hypothetical protein